MITIAIGIGILVVGIIVIGILVIVIVDQIMFLHIVDPQVFSLTPHSPSQVDWLLELRW